MPQWTLNENVGGLSVSRSVSADGEGSWTDGAPLTANQADVEVDCDMVFARIKGFIVKCLGACKIETNANDATGGNTLNIPAGGYVYLSGGVEANPFSANITRLFVTDMSNAVNPIQIKWLYDMTP